MNTRDDSMISGIDLPPIQFDRRSFAVRSVLDVVYDFWPWGQFQDADRSSAIPVSELIEGASEPSSDEFFVYRDQSSFVSWYRDGRTAENANSLLHFFVRADANDPQSVNVGIDVDDFDEEMIVIYQAIEELAADGSSATMLADLPIRRRNIEAELRDAGSALHRTDFYDLVDSVRQSFYPAWTQDELACHPHDALQFCDVVRRKAGAPLPDHLIMRALINRRKRSR